MQPRPRRPGVGKTALRPLKLLANHFHVICKLKQVILVGIFCPCIYCMAVANFHHLFQSGSCMRSPCAALSIGGF